MKFRSVPVRLAGFVAGLLAVFGIGLGVGAAFGPEPEAVPPATTESPSPTHDMTHGAP